MAKHYEAKGGDYEDTGDNPNKAKTGDPTPKKSAVEKGERKDPLEKVGTPKSKKTNGDKEDQASKESSKRKSDAKAEDQDKAKPKKAKTAKAQKPAAKGTREQPKRGVKK